MDDFQVLSPQVLVIHVGMEVFDSNGTAGLHSKTESLRTADKVLIAITPVQRDEARRVSELVQATWRIGRFSGEQEPAPSGSLSASSIAERRRQAQRCEACAVRR
jgi:hypothetical protein